MTKTMLERFQVNGAQPLLESRVREMIVAGNDARFLRSWDLKPLEEKMKMELVLSIQERKKRVERRAHTWKSYLSQAHDVMIALQEQANKTWQQVADMSAKEREDLFNAAFDATCRRLFPDMSDTARDAKRMLNMSYMTFYKHLSSRAMLRKTLGKRKKRGGDEEDEDELVALLKGAGSSTATPKATPAGKTKETTPSPFSTPASQIKPAKSTGKKPHHTFESSVNSSVVSKAFSAESREGSVASKPSGKGKRPSSSTEGDAKTPRTRQRKK